MGFTFINATQPDIDQFNAALSYLSRSSHGAAIVQQAAASNVSIVFNHSNDHSADGYSELYDQIRWDPNSAQAVVSDTGGIVGIQSPALGLLHELAHRTDPNYSSNVAQSDPQYDDLAEKYAVEQENIVADDLGEPQRYNHITAAYVVAADSTAHTTAVFDGSMSERMVWVRVDAEGNPIVQGAYQLGTYPDVAPNLPGAGSTVFDDSGTQPWLSQTLIRDINGILQLQLDVYDSGASLLRYYDTQNTHPYSQLDITRDILGHITGANATLDVDVAAIGGSVGQVLGSAIGRALAPNNQFAQLAAGTVAGAIGQKFGQIISSSLKADATGIAVGDVFANFGINLASAGAGSIASFLTAEIGTALGLDGYGAQLFNASVGGFAGSVAQQVALHGMGQINSINWGSVFTSVEVNIGGALGSMLAHQIIQAQTQSGAIGGQIAGAIGSAIGAAIVGQGLGLALNIVIPGLGSLIGTLVGTIIGDLIEGDPQHPYAEDTIDPSSYSYGSNRYYVAAGGDGNAVDQMAAAASSVVNAYLTAVDGVGLAYSKQVHIGYQTVNQNTPYFWGEYGRVDLVDENGEPVVYWGTIYHPAFATIDGLINAVAVDLVRSTEAIGGDLLLKRAHQHSQYSDTMTLAADLQVAQDYKNYLGNREAINALMAAYPNSAFTAGWIATFARVNDLGLNHYGASDFFGGMVMGYLDSVRKDGLNFDPADVSVKHGSDGSVTIEIHVGNNVEVPGVLSAFASHTNEISDASGKTIQLVFTDGLVAGGFHGPSSTTLANGVLQHTAASGNNIWFGQDVYPNLYNDTQASSQDILIGGAQNDTIYAGSGFDFVDGGAGNDYINGRAGNDILRGGAGHDFADGGEGDDNLDGGAGNDRLYGGVGNDVLRGGTGADALYGGGGNDTYVFNRGDGDDVVLDDYQASGGHANGGSDRLVFGAGISRSDIVLQVVGNDLIVSIKDPNHPATPLGQFTDKITIKQWADSLDRIETFVFADGTTMDLAAGISVTESTGSTSLMAIGNVYYLYENGIGSQLIYGGLPITVGRFGAEWTLIGAERTASGYEVALRASGTDQYTVWNFDSSGLYVSNGTGGNIVSGGSNVLRSLEPSFHQDLNGDGVIGIPAPVIESFGSTSLTVQSGYYYLTNNGTGAGPQLTYGGSPVFVGRFGSEWTFFGAEQTASGYQVALRSPGSDQYTVWNTDSSGAVVSNGTGGVVVSGTSTILESLEPSFHQDLNGDGVIGIPTTVIESFGSTSLTVRSGYYYLTNNSTGAGPQFQYDGSPVFVDRFGSEWTFIGAEQTASGYQVALRSPGTDQYTVWNTNSSGTVVSNGTGGVVVSGTSSVLESLEPSFHQDLNGDGVIGIPTTVIESFGSTTLVVQFGAYYLNGSSTLVGTQLVYDGLPITVGRFGSEWSLIGAEQTAAGYELALHSPGTDQFTVWNFDGNGVFVSNATGGIVSGASSVLRSLEPSFHQDLNGDGVIGIPSGAPVILDLDGGGAGIAQLSASAAYFDMDGRAGVEHTAWVSTGDGLLAIDLAANGSSGSDGVIDQTREIVFTQWAPGTTSDMAALAQVFDTNHNGQLDSGDNRWNEFRVWQDTDGDGVSQPNEVKWFDAVGIVSIGLDPTGPSQTFADGSAISGLSNFIWKGGHVGTAADVSLAYQPDDSASGHGIGAAFHFVDTPHFGQSGQEGEILHTFVEEGFPTAQPDNSVPAEASGTWLLAGIEMQEAIAKSHGLAVHHDLHLV
jgi:Ca2+-binding RTX toxin-like protein/20S proteasome alpha/beta subunit